jgi:hypothetical protein
MSIGNRCKPSRVGCVKAALMFTYENNRPDFIRHSRNMRRRGAVVAEMVIVVPLLALFLFSIVQYSVIMSTFAKLPNITRDTNRYAAVVGPEEILADVKTNATCTSISSYRAKNGGSIGLVKANGVTSAVAVEIGTLDFGGNYALDEAHERQVRAPRDNRSREEST